MPINQAMETETNLEIVAALLRERRFEEAANLAEVVLGGGSGVARILALRPPFN